jgi:hypothetical protein
MTYTDDEYEPDPLEDGDYDEDRETTMFADPGGHSALRAATKENPRNVSCPTCKRPNKLTPLDVELGYQCDRCADALESGRDFEY